MKCPHCGVEIALTAADAAGVLGKMKSEKKAKAVRENGKKGGEKGGRPKKKME